MTDDSIFDELSEHARAVAGAGSAAEVFKALLEASRIVAPRASVFLVRKSEIHGWGSFGYGTDVAHAQRAFRAPQDEGWLGEVLRATAGGAVARGDATAPDFGQPAAAESVACSMKIDGRPIAILMAERGAGESPWLRQGLALLVAVGEMRLELDLARRRAAAVARPDAPVAERPAAKAAEPEPAVAAEPEPAAEPAADLEPARRYARLVATDIRLYNEEAVMLGRRNGDLTDRIGEHLGRGKETFLRRHPELGRAGLDLLHEAYVQVLAGGDASLIPDAVTKR